MSAPIRIMAILGRMACGRVTPEEAVEVAGHLDELNAEIRVARNAALEEAEQAVTDRAEQLSGRACDAMAVISVADAVDAIRAKKVTT